MRTALVTLAAVLGFAAQVAEAAPPVSIVPSSSQPAASEPARRLTPLQRAETRVGSTSPAAAAEAARAPGELRPENAVVPQVAIGLRRDKPTTGPRGDNGIRPGSIDDEAARCMARETAAERAECRQTGDSTRPTIK